MNRVVVTRCIVGICHMQVCAVADASDEEILEVCNRENPAGTEMGWAEVIRTGEGKPGPCADHADRLHILVFC